MNYTKKYRKIVNDLIKKSFPKLKNEDVQIYEIPKWIVWWVNGFVFNRYIFVTSRLREFNIKAQIGFFAHELCHVEDSQNRPFFLEFFYFMKGNLKWLFFAFSSQKRERKTDLKTIKKGYAKGLYQFEVLREKKFSKKKLSNLLARGYLASRQIKSYAKKIGKW